MQFLNKGSLSEGQKFCQEVSLFYKESYFLDKNVQHFDVLIISRKILCQRISTEQEHAMTEKSNENSDRQTQNAESNATRFSALVNASGLAIGIDLLLIALKYLLATLTGSPVLFADAFHSGGDLAVSLIVLISIVVHYWLKDNPWAKEAEAVVALLISVLLMTGSVHVVLGALRSDAAQFLLLRGIPVVIAIAGISIALGLTFTMSRFKRRIGEQYASIAFIAEGMHTHSDFLTSAGVWLTLLLGYFGIHIERVTTLLIGLAVFQIGLRLFFQALQAFSITPAIISSVKNATPASLRSTLHTLRQTVSQFVTTITSLAPRMFFMREEWVFTHKYRLIVWNGVLVMALYAGTGFYSVQPYQTGLELFFGNVTEHNPPGLYAHAPKPFGDVMLVDTAVTARVESGFRTNWDYTGEEPAAYLWEFTHTEGRYHKVPAESIALTGDETLVDTNFLCYYRITDPVQYALNSENASRILQSLFVHEVQAELRHYQLDQLLTSERGNIQMELLQNMQRAVAELPLGVEILDVYMREAHPPIEVVPSYRAVASARESKIEIIHTAHTYTNAILPLSRGQAAAKIAQAEADATERVAATKGNAQSFLVKQRTFSQFEAVQRVRLWWETVETVLKNKTLYILPQNAKRRVYSSGTIAAGETPGDSLKGRYEEDEHYYGPEEHPEDDRPLP